MSKGDLAGGMAQAGIGGTGSDLLTGKITPGVALLDSHRSGTGDRSLYGTVDLDVEDDYMYLLVLGEEQLDIGLVSGGEFSAALSGENSLTLTTDETDAKWHISMAAMQTLADSGLETIVVQVGDDQLSVSTDMELGGRVYANLRKEGYPLSSYTIYADSEGLTLGVGEESYTVDDDMIVAAR